MMQLLHTLKFIWSHPLSSGRKLDTMTGYFRWQIGSRLVPGAVAVPFVNGTRLLAKPGMTGATGNVYTGLHELHDMGFVLHVLRSQDLFVDVGANIGSYTILAGGAVGAACVAIEPEPHTYSELQDNLRLNNINCSALNVAVGSCTGEVEFTSGMGPENHVVTDQDHVDRRPTVRIPMKTLDEVLAGLNPTVIKIDVEGYEANVVRGAEHVLHQDSLLAVLLELTGNGNRYGVDEQTIHTHMLRVGFTPFRYDACLRELTPISSTNADGKNTLYVRSVDEVKQRLKTALRFRVKNTEI